VSFESIGAPNCIRGVSETGQQMDIEAAGSRFLIRTTETTEQSSILLRTNTIDYLIPARWSRHSISRE
jgi:hypothetical protein